MADEMTNIESAVLEEESRLRDLGVGLDLEEVAGQQMMAADAQRAATASTQQGFQNVLGAADLAAEQFDLFDEGRAAKQLALQEQQLAVIRQRPEVQALKGVELSNDTLAQKTIQQALQRIDVAPTIDPFSYAPSMYPTPLNLPKIK